MPHKNELTVKKTMHVRKKRLRPSQPTRKPLIGSTMAFDTEITGQHPSALIIARAQVARDVREAPHSRCWYRALP